MMWWPSTLHAGAEKGSTQPKATAGASAAAEEIPNDGQCEERNGGGTPNGTKEGRRDPFYLIWEGMSELGSRDGQGARSFSHTLSVHGVDTECVSSADCTSAFSVPHCPWLELTQRPP